MQSALRTLAGPLAESAANKREMGVLSRFAQQQALVIWDFSVDGGANGTIHFNTQLPANAVVTKVVADEVTPVTGSTALSLKAGSTTLTGPTDFTGISGVNSIALAGGATAIKVSSASELNLLIASGPATAGKLLISVHFYISAQF